MFNGKITLKPTLGLFIPGAGSGGPWRSVHSILGGLDLDEFEVQVFCDLEGQYAPRPEIGICYLHGSQSSEQRTNEAVTPSNARSRAFYRHLAPPFVRTWAGFGRQTRKLAALLRRQPVDLLHTHTTGCEESAVAARLAGIPAVLGTFHVDSTYDLQGVRSGVTHRTLEHLSNHCLHRAIGVSEATARDWIRRTHLPACRVVTIHNGIDADQFIRRSPRAAARAQLGLPCDDRLILGGVGRLEEAKGFSFLLEAVALLAKTCPNLLLVLAGQGPLREQLAEQAARLGIGERVRFLGFCADVQQVYDALDVFVLSSLCEALPYALLEAMATCLPAVGTTVGGVPEVIVPGETGFLVPPRDPAALATALRPLLESQVLRQRLGHAGRERVEQHFREDEMVRKTIQVYRDMLKGHRRVRVSTHPSLVAQA
jgi:glycosyltransferase involved in cell wall biosynthesis